MMNDIHEVLKKSFGYDSFRDNQQEIIESVIDGKDALVLMPTGGGKSLCYQIPALVFEGITIVVSPLISLMKDQVESLLSNGIEARYFNSSLSAEEELEVLDLAKSGQLKLLYLSPEKLVSGMNNWMTELNISLVAIDEAHCVSMWGHDFRPEYTQMKSFRDQLSHVPFIALTATADKTTRKDIIGQIGLNEAKTYLSSFNRENLSLDVRANVPKKTKIKEIQEFVLERPRQSGIIYCLSRKGTEEIAKDLKVAGIDAVAYHAGLSSEKRAKIQEDFINDRSQIICATIAFGMGIDKSNVRWVIHNNLPKNLEGYYQEIGRAGRDGLPSDTVLYYNMRDFVLYSQFADNGANSGMQKEKLSRMLQFAEAKSCRRKILLSYFGEHLTQDCGNCDVCSNPPTNFDGTILAQKALSTVVRLKEKEGIAMVVNVLRGSQNAEIHAKGYARVKTYGIATETSFFDWRDYMVQLANQGALEIMYSENSSLKMTEIGWKIVKGEMKLQLTRPIQLKDKEKLKKKKPVKTVSLNDVNNDLFEELRKLRYKIASEENVPAYIVFGDKSLKEMAADLPTIENEFLAISGVGMNKMEQFGEEFMEVIKKFKDVAKPVKIPTTLETFALYKEGLKPIEIAEKRNLQITTVYSHLSQLYSEGKEVELEKFVDQGVVDKVRVAFNELDREIALKPVYEKLNEEVSYGEIRLSIALILKNE
mgnify:CR=1 FL=1